MDEDAGARLAQLREAAQRAYAWAEYVETHQLPEDQQRQAERERAHAALVLDQELEQRGLERGEDLDAAQWYEPADYDRHAWAHDEQDEERGIGY